MTDAFTHDSRVSRPGDPLTLLADGDRDRLRANASAMRAAMRSTVALLEDLDLSPADSLFVWERARRWANGLNAEWTRSWLQSKRRTAHHVDLSRAAAASAAEVATYDTMLADFRDALGGHIDPLQRAVVSHDIIVWLERWAAELRAVRADAVEQAATHGESTRRIAALLGVTRQAVNLWRQEAVRAMQA